MLFLFRVGSSLGSRLEYARARGGVSTFRGVVCSDVEVSAMFSGNLAVTHISKSRKLCGPQFRNISKAIRNTAESVAFLGHFWAGLGLDWGGVSVGAGVKGRTATALNTNDEQRPSHERAYRTLGYSSWKRTGDSSPRKICFFTRTDKQKHGANSFFELIVIC